MRRKKTPKLLRIPSISNAEWAVMQVIWSKGKATANEVVEALSGHMEWKPKTIHTLLRRLSDKGVLSFEQIGREYVFTATVTGQECQLAESRSFLSRVFGTDTVTPLVAAFARQEEISPAEIAELRLLLDKLESDSAS